MVKILGLLRSCRLASVSRSWRPVRTVRTVCPPSRTTRGANGASLSARTSSAAHGHAPAMGPARAQKATHRRHLRNLCHLRCQASAAAQHLQPGREPQCTGVWGCIFKEAWESVLRDLCAQKSGNLVTTRVLPSYWYKKDPTPGAETSQRPPSEGFCFV